MDAKYGAKIDTILIIIYLMMIGLDFRFTDMQIKQRTEQKRSSMDIMRII